MKIPCIALFLLVGLCSLGGEDPDRDWFPFAPRNDYSPGAIDMTDWVDAPAGKHGFLQMRGDALVFENGTPVKFWGTNIASERPFADPETVDLWVRQMRKYGINAVRFHKFTWEASDGRDSTRVTSDRWERFDYFTHQLREHGIYHGWSHIYGHRVRPADREKLAHYDEIAGLRYPWSHLNGSTSALVNFAPDLQALSIELTVNMLNHVNPYTGLRYAEDPALAFIELQNEDNIFWSAIGRALEQAPSYRALLYGLFSDWLREKYGGQEALVAAWGRDNLPEDQSLAGRNIDPQPSHSLFQWHYEEAAKADRAMPRHILDKMRFLYEQQVAFYRRFVDAIRATGYRGVIVGSCWQAGSGIAHYYNLHADYLAGMIDRHNYFGGGTGHRMEIGEVRADAMVSRPGSGLLSTGLQQVADRPFALSEWMSLLPNEWIAESTPLIAAYGMGLQGWDASFHFAHDLNVFSSSLQAHGVYNVTSPTQLGLYPAVARMVHRGDVKEGAVVSRRHVHIPSLADGKLGFFETLDQGFDDKFMTGDVPAEALAYGRLVVDFVDSFRPTRKMALEEMQCCGNNVIYANNDQLTWDYNGRGYVTIDTAGTQGVVGFAGGRSFPLGDFRLRMDNPFGVVLITALEPNASLRTADRVLVTTMARARNTGMRYNADGTRLLAVGEAPVRLEPVVVDLASMRPGEPVVHVLDHDGHRTGDTLPVEDGKVTLDGRETHAIYYELVFD